MTRFTKDPFNLGSGMERMALSQLAKTTLTQATSIRECEKERVASKLKIKNIPGISKMTRGKDLECFSSKEALMSGSLRGAK